MTKTRKTLIFIFLVFAFIMAGIGSYAKFVRWNILVCCGFVLGGLILATAALVVAMWRPKMK